MEDSEVVHHPGFLDYIPELKKCTFTSSNK